MFDEMRWNDGFVRRWMASFVEESFYPCSLEVVLVYGGWKEYKVNPTKSLADAMIPPAPAQISSSPGRAKKGTAGLRSLVPFGPALRWYKNPSARVPHSSASAMESVERVMLRGWKKFSVTKEVNVEFRRSVGRYESVSYMRLLYWNSWRISAEGLRYRRVRI